jgi:hypothetical protein
VKRRPEKRKKKKPRCAEEVVDIVKLDSGKIESLVKAVPSH